jgi:UDP-hydrolysing UDP-N-acetyl-D-glucosamine 2-epimerase
MRRIGLFTATRAEYGLLKPVLRALDASSSLEPHLIVSGAHLSAAHGLTRREIEADGRAIAAEVPMPLRSDEPVDIAADMAAVVAGAAEAYRRLALDAVLLLGDRTEALAAAVAAVPLALPIVHLEGGHVTTGAIDDSIRHAITKLAALHFTAAGPYRRRLLQLGEAPERVFAVGSTAIDNLRALQRWSRDDLAADIGLDLSPGFILATFHPETLSALSAEAQADAFLAGLTDVGDRRIVFTMPNADAGSTTIRKAIQAFVSARPREAIACESLGAERYLSAVALAEAVVGNSSSGVIEAPALRTPSVNIGDRQGGRLRPPGVIDCPADAAAIRAALARALEPGFRAALRDAPPPFGDGHAAERIVAVLEQADFAALRRKPFVDLP